MQTTSTAISCFFNKRKRNVIVLFVSTFKNTTLVLIPGSKWRETERLNAEKAKTTGREKEKIEKDGQRSTTADEWMVGGERMEGIFKKVLNFPSTLLPSPYG